ncbi:MAG: non-canonical purine NTP pyrophosphatase [Treponema sp.]|jgi:XTP/dITP diphosphohydrolase|nr:non-canonical purine NTP pyrophosphatase [Treponema sp.]
MNIWLASGNVHKKRELAVILAGHQVIIPADRGITDFAPDENGTGFAENALIKARALYAHPAFCRADGAVLADDSGLCVDILDGRPGIFSARYGSDGKKKIGAAERNALLLEEVNAAIAGGKTIPGGRRRSCRFVCAMALFFDPYRFCVVQETLEGELVPDMGAARGSGGFGYDPIVFLPERGRTVAELSETEKNAVSHRGRAGRAISKLLAFQRKNTVMLKHRGTVPAGLLHLLLSSEG